MMPLVWLAFLRLACSFASFSAPSLASVPGVAEEGVLQLARSDHAEQLAGVAAHGVEQLLRVEGLMLELVHHRLDDGGVPVAEHVDAEAAEAVDELLAVDVVEDVALVAPLDGGVVGGAGLAVLEDAGVDVLVEVRETVADHRLLLVARQFGFRHQVERLARFSQRLLPHCVLHSFPLSTVDRLHNPLICSRVRSYNRTMTSIYRDAVRRANGG